MPTAVCLIRNTPHYRLDAFVHGLSAVGYKVNLKPARPASRDDVLIVWNRSAVTRTVVESFEQAGNTILVAENGYLGNDPTGHQLYAMARQHHNGAGQWGEGEADRWSPLGIDLKPWRKDGRHILILPQRGIGPAGVAMPPTWIKATLRRVREVTDRPVVLRHHPGKFRPPMDGDLRDCWAAVTWGSTAALKAIVAGVPVVHELQNWIGGSAASLGLASIENPFLGDRLPMLRRLAWAQWAVSEIHSGAAFRWLLQPR